MYHTTVVQIVHYKPGSIYTIHYLNVIKTADTLSTVFINIIASPIILHLLLFFAKANMLSVGSDPMERKQIMGDLVVDSSNMPSISRTTPSAYSCPMALAMYILAIGMQRSGHQDLMSRSLWKRSSWEL